SLFHPRSCRGFPPPKRQQNRPPRPRIRVCFREMAWVNGVSGVLHPFVFFGVFPCVWVFPTPSYHMLCNYHTSFRVTPTTHSLTHSLTNTQASPHRHARRPGQRPPPQPTTSNTQQAHPSTTKVVHQQATQTTETTQTTTSNPTHTREHAQVAHQQATRRPRRRPTSPPTPSNMLEHAHSPHPRHPQQPQGDHE